MNLKKDTRLIRGVLFDFDGTLTEPGSLNFAVIGKAIGCPRGRPVLEFIRDMESDEERAAASRILDGFEAEAARHSRPNLGAENVLEYLQSRQIKFGIISRNSLESIRTALENFQRIRSSDFSVILSRDDPYSPKPSPEGILAAARMLGIPVSEVLVVGDFVFDVEAGHRAGALTAFLTNRGTLTCAYTSDFTLEHLGDLIEIVDMQAPLLAGKLPNDLLRQFLQRVGAGDDSLLVAPGIGEDVAALPLSGEEVLVLKSDPITFATDAAGFYAVAVNVNDIATSGATPRWLLASLLFPVGTNAARILATMEDLQAAARAQGLILCGGHTEVTDAVTRPVIAAQVTGTVCRKALIDKKKMVQGNRVVLTKALAIEGTSIIAREFPERLRSLGMGDDEIRRCQNFLADPGISVLQAAKLAMETGGVTAMHDITEGGIATALQELSTAGGHRIRVVAEQIPVYPETEKICRLMEISPLGLIGSGSLLITCAEQTAMELIDTLRNAGVEAVCLGEVLERGCGIEAIDAKGNRKPWPNFEIDELARLCSTLAAAPS
jgi:hydrogenase expression/formation protein HypE